MKKQNAYKSEPLGARIIQRLTDFANALESQEGIFRRLTLRRILLDLRPGRYNPKRIKKTRAALGASQAVFAQFLGVSFKTVQAWEQGINAPTAMACRFMDEIGRNPDYWRKRLNGVVVTKKAGAKSAGGRAV